MAGVGGFLADSSSQQAGYRLRSGPERLCVIALALVLRGGGQAGGGACTCLPAREYVETGDTDRECRRMRLP